MNTATVNSLNLHLEKSDVMLSAKVPVKMKKLIKRLAKQKNMSESAYIKLAINNQLNTDML